MFSTNRHTDKVVHGIGQLTTHGQVFHQFSSVLTLLLGGLDEVLGKSGTIHGVGGEVCSHGQVLGGGKDLLLNLLAHALNAGSLHVGPSLEDRIRLDVACNPKDE